MGMRRCAQSPGCLLSFCSAPRSYRSARALGVMRLTWPENTAPLAGHPIAGLNPLLYSLDVFLPFVNLHQEHYWWPDETASGDCAIFGRSVPVRGSMLRYYLWLQIMAGWLAKRGVHRRIDRPDSKRLRSAAIHIIHGD